MVGLEVAKGVGAAAIALAGTSPKVWSGRRWTRIPVARNHRGATVPVNLGFGVALALLALAPFVGFHAAGWWLAGGILVVFVAGYLDDRRPARIRGLRTHLRALAHGRFTTGILKLLAAVAASLAWVLATHGSVARIALGVPVIAGTTNLFNLLDVAPGRSAKYGLVAALALAAGGYDSLLAVTAGALVALLPLDVRERGMLGDSGSNVLGFALGVALYGLLSTAGLAIALVAILVLHALAETVTLSRIIDATPPLRWFDRLGRLRTPEEPRGAKNP